MGGIYSSIRAKLFGDQKRIVMLGLDGAGKTTMLFRLSDGDVSFTAPALRFSVESIVYKGMTIAATDLIGSGSSPSAWRDFFQHTQAVILVVDSTVREQLDNPNQKLPSGQSAKEALARCLQYEELKGAPLLVLANKQDLEGALQPDEVAKLLCLDQLEHRQWHIQGCSAATGDGLSQGLDWLEAAHFTRKMER